MSFALTAFRARGIRIDGVQPDRAIQQAVLSITGAVTDVDLDIGDDDGTFWTAAIADTTAAGGTTYGAIAASALLALQTITDNAFALSKIFVPELAARLQAGTASTTSYEVALEEKRPNFTFAASNGELAYTVILEWILLPGIPPVDVVFNVAPA